MRPIKEAARRAAWLLALLVLAAPVLAAPVLAAPVRAAPVLAAGVARASSTILRYASPYAADHPFSRADLAFIAAVARRSGGTMRIMPYWGGSLMGTEEDVLELAHGVADIALVTPIYSLAGMAAIKLQAGFYAGARTVAAQVAVYGCLARQFRELGAEMGGTKLLVVQGGPLLHVLTRTRPIRTLADFAGLRLRAPDELVPTLRALGADPVTMPMGLVYAALSKGSIDGVVAPADTLKSLHFVEVARNFSLLSLPRGAYPARAIRRARWERLSPAEQAVLRDASADWQAALAQSLHEAEAAGLAYGVAHGERFEPADPAAQAALEALYRREAASRVAEERARVPDGPAMYARAEAAIAALAAGRPPC